MSFANRLVLRRVHVRQFLGTNRFEVWADDKLVKACRGSAEVDAAVRRVLDVADDDSAHELAHELERIGRDV